MAEGVLFTEQQRFTQWWLWLILCSVSWGNNPMSDTGLYVMNASLLLLLIFFLLLKLETRITKEGINVRFFPFHMKARHYSWADIDKANVRTYSPIGEYGGWGLKTGSGADAYNVSGEKGIQLVFKRGRKLLIGTNKSEEAARVLAMLNISTNAVTADF